MEDAVQEVNHHWSVLTEVHDPLAGLELVQRLNMIHSGDQRKICLATGKRTDKNTYCVLEAVVPIWQVVNRNRASVFSLVYTCHPTWISNSISYFYDDQVRFNTPPLMVPRFNPGRGVA